MRVKTKTEINRLVENAMRTGNWMIRRDDDGVSFGGFQWRPVGEWTEAPDWNSAPVCGGGLHGVNHRANGFVYRVGATLAFCEIDPNYVVIDGNKIKTPRAKRLLLNELPDVAEIPCSLDVSGTQIKELPAGLTSIGGKVRR